MRSRHLIRVIHAQRVKFWCGRTLETPEGEAPGPVAGMAELEAEQARKSGPKVCGLCLRALVEHSERAEFRRVTN